MLCEAEKYIQKFETFVRGHGSTETADVAKLLIAVKRISDLPMEEFGGEAHDERERIQAKRDAMADCVRTFVAQRMSEDFPLLDEKLFGFRRWIGVRFGDKPEVFTSVVKKPEQPSPKSPERWVETRLLVKSSAPNWNRNRRNGAVTLGTIPVPGQRSKECTLYAKFPGVVGGRQTHFAHKAMAKLYRIHADLLDRPETALLTRQHITVPDLAAYWIPSLESIFAVEERAADRRDPALVLHVAGRRFLCCMWSAEGEQPLEAIMREFSEGGIVNMADEDE